MKILITGARGMLAQAVRKRFSSPDNDLILTDVSGDGVVPSNGGAKIDTIALDITDKDRVFEVITSENPDLVINCAAYTAVDKAEVQEELAHKINADGPTNLAEACAKNGATLVHISTDYVFGGSKPVSEDYLEDDEKTPNSAYGRTKLAGEQGIVGSGCNYYIFRTAWLYGEGKNFVRTMLEVGTSQVEKGTAEVSVVNDQHGSPTYAEDLTSIIYQAVEKKIPFGVYDATNLGYTTWAEFTEEIYKLAGLNCAVKGISSEEYEASAKARAAEKGEDYKVADRPKNSQMSKQKLLDAGIEIPSWEDGLKRYLKKEGKLAI